jgi:ribosomal protein L11 methyltransferase
MHIWRKRVTGEWLRRKGDDLQVRFGSALAITEEPGKARAAVAVSCDRRTGALRLQRELGGTIEKLAADWLDEFTRRTPAKPLRIGSRLIVARSKGAEEDARRTIVIPAEAAFGTGDHATTAMCLRLLERITRKRTEGWSLLDAGTGSGILAIAASRLGANRIVAIDNDPMACAIAERNAEANGARNIEFRTGDVLKRRRGKFDVITANLYSEILIAALEGWSRLLANDGHLILSGILRPQEPSVAAALRRHEFALRETKRRGKWVALLALPARKNS